MQLLINNYIWFRNETEKLFALKLSDGGNVSSSTLLKFLENCHATLPLSSPVKGIVTDMLGDSIYPLKSFSKLLVTYEEKVFN